MKKRPGMAHLKKRNYIFDKEVKISTMGVN